ncbi:glycosyltransferase-like domain-containing protein 1-like isoform X2 [Anopheles albimanus]|uniref:glycosyltransferase-like domain-containing protein 1-like isoform X2 n=1 Tax=Anopheles albimanus TaxID=7167 RepID=UPI001640562B|nr:glycosyltransferase-like domain-containing protein 1-like isoform X2 [Anopheles albimanus]
MAQILVLEAFYGGSHKQLLDVILKDLDPTTYDLYTIPAKKWHWCARMSALHFAEVIPAAHQYRLLFTSSVLNLAELIGLRPDLGRCRRIVYFHENQLCYPVRESKQRDVQYGVNQITACLCADAIRFNSRHNMHSFLDSIQSFLSIVPNMKFKGIREKIAQKCKVLYFPIAFHQIPRRTAGGNRECVAYADDRRRRELHLIWPHRWEHDKHPEQLVDALLALQAKGVDFRVSILGERFETVPACFDQLSERLPGKVIHFGPQPKDDYYRTLMEGDVVLSTALHEFYGVAMLEAVHCGCVPLAPNRLVYPELYPKDKLYNTTEQLVKQLYNWCRNRPLFEKHRQAFFDSFAMDPYSADHLVPVFVKLLNSF